MYKEITPEDQKLIDAATEVMNYRTACGAVLPKVTLRHAQGIFAFSYGNLAASGEVL